MLRFRILTAKHLVTRKLSDTFINTNKIYKNLIIANPLTKQIFRTLISAMQK